MKSKLVLITNSYPYGNGEQFLETEIKYLSSEFSSIYILPMHKKGLCRKVPDNVYLLEIKISKIKAIISSIFSITFYKELFKNYSKLKRIILFFGIANQIYRKIKPFKKEKDTIFYSYWALESALAISFIKGRKTITRLHRGDLYEEMRESQHLPFRNIIYKRIDVLAPISENGLNYLKLKYNVKNNVKVFRLGVENDEKYMVSMSPPDCFVVVSCSFLVPHKRVDLIASSLILLSNLVKKKVFWYHIGDGPERDKINKLIKINENNLYKNVVGHLSNSEVFEFYRNHEIDIFINLSTTEGIPVSIMEAQSFGIPVLANNVGGIPEIVNNENGFLIEPEANAEKVANYLYTIASNKEILIEKKKISKKNWLQNYNAYTNYHKFIKYIKTY